MRIENAELHFLHIPFRVSVTHGARAARTYSDSIVLRVTADGRAGYGEAIVRDYVSGSLGTGDALHAETARVIGGLLSPLRGREVTWGNAAEHLLSVTCDTRCLPLVCAVESALLACAAEIGRVDPWTVIGREPLRTAITFSGVLPMFPLEEAEPYIGLCRKLRLTSLKVKLGADPAYNDALLALCRGTLGDTCDLRVDANSAWTVAMVAEQAALCAKHGVRVIEQPLPVNAPGGAEACARLAAQGFSIMADEGVLTPADVRTLGDTGAAQMLNLRLSKNGGLTRLLDLAAEAEKRGLGYQLGCMVGETGVLSAMGRIAASLLPRPAYLEGGYDELLLEDNITVPGFGFGPGGNAHVERSPGMGYRVDEGKLAGFSAARIAV